MGNHRKGFLEIVKLVEQILSLDSDNDISKIKSIEEEINNIVYKIYNLTEDDIRMIETSCNS